MGGDSTSMCWGIRLSESSIRCQYSPSATPDFWLLKSRSTKELDQNVAFARYGDRQTMSSKVLAFINFKGGVGKTATVVNIGATLAKLHRKKVLIVDLDPQSNSSVWLMRPDRWRQHVAKGHHSTFQIFDDALQAKDRFKFDDAVV